MTDITVKMSATEKVVYEKYRNSFPFPVVQFADEIGLKIFVTEKAPESMCGAISKHNDEYHIVVNGNHSETRMRFTVAHELGHYFNDKAYLDNAGEIKDESKQSKKWLFRQDNAPHDPAMARMDVLANRLAADLLMPKDAFIEKWEELRTPEDVAEFFNVSPDAARVRAAVLLGEIV